MRQGGAEVSSTRRWSPWVNLRQTLQVCAWSALSRREDDHLSLLSSEIQCYNIGIAVLSEVWRPDSCDIMAVGYNDYRSGCSDGYHTQGVVVAVSNKLTPLTIEVTLVNKLILRLRIRHSLPRSKLVDWCPRRDTLLVLWDLMHQLALIEMVMRHVLVPLCMEL